jgi:hypothetical protein
MQSLSQVFSTVSMPAGDEGSGSMWIAIGNDVTCELQAFSSVVGTCGGVLYSFSLTLYFLLVIKFELSEANIKKKFEPLMHAFPILYSVIMGVFIYATHSYNPSGTSCWIESRPLGCKTNPDVECESIGNPVILKSISFGIPFYFVFFANCFILGVIWHKVYSQSQARKKHYRMQSWAAPSRRPEDQEETQGPQTQTQEKSSDKGCSHFLCLSSCAKSPHQQQQDLSSESPLAARLARPSRAMVQRMREISIRAAAYIIGFLITYIFSIVYRFWQLQEGEVPFFIIILARFFYPLQGFLNVLIYTSPHVESFRRNHDQCSWLRAFLEVIKSGGDSDDTRAGKTNHRNSLRQQKLVLEASERRAHRDALSGAVTMATARSLRNDNRV